MSPIPDITHSPSFSHASSVLYSATWENNGFGISQSNVTSLLSTGSNSQNVVQWQSALWALVALALNAMTQPSGADRIPTRSMISLLRSSPFICLMDSVSSIAWVIVGRFYGESAANSIRLMNMDTNLSIGDKNENEVGGDRKSDTGSLPLVGAIFFILGPLPQAIKIAGMTGVPWVKVAGLVYMLAYLLRVWELHLRNQADQLKPSMVWSKSLSITGPKIPELVRQRLTTFSGEMYSKAFTFQCLAWLVVAHSLTYVIQPASNEAASSEERDPISPILRFVSAANCLWPIALAAVPGFMVGKAYLGERLRRRYSVKLSEFPMRTGTVLQACLSYGPAVISSFSVLVSVVYTFHYLKCLTSSDFDKVASEAAFSSTRSSVFGIVRMVLAIFVLILSVPALSIVFSFVSIFLALVMGFEEVGKKRKLSAKEEEEETDYECWKIVSLGFAICNLFFALLYFRFVYDAEGTALPGWSSMLG